MHYPIDSVKEVLEKNKEYIEEMFMNMANIYRIKDFIHKDLIKTSNDKEEKNEMLFI